jgi:thioredoxin-like negative regulator of GroEL
VSPDDLPAIALAIAFSLWASLAGALEIEPFTAEALAQAQRADAPIALHFHSKSCGTCRLQSKAFEAMRAEPGLEMTLLVVDFDDDSKTPRAFRVFVAGAVVVLRGAVERTRLMGVVDPRQLREALLTAF